MGKGLKRICTNCSTRFYDMDKTPIICPVCGTKHTGDVKVKSRRGRPATAQKEALETNSIADETIEDIDADDDVVSLDDLDDNEDTIALSDDEDQNEDLAGLDDNFDDIDDIDDLDDDNLDDDETNT